MSNVKMVEVEYLLPFYWPDALDDTRAAFLGRLFLGTSGLHFTERPDHYEPNEGGGQTSMHRVTITGEEALGWKGLEMIVEALEYATKCRPAYDPHSKPMGEKVYARAMDIEGDPGHSEWSELTGDVEVPA